MFFDSWHTLLRTLVVGALAYTALITLIRLGGKRTLSKWNAFDLVITVAFGSALASAVLDKETRLAQAVAAFALLVVLQFLVTWLAMHSERLERWINGRPTLLLYRGEYQDGAMRAERVSRAEIRAALRARGVATVSAVEAVVLETDGSFSIIVQPPKGSPNTLEDVHGFPPGGGPS